MSNLCSTSSFLAEMTPWRERGGQEGAGCVTMTTAGRGGQKQ